MKRTYMIFLALCLVGGILVWIMSRPKIVESPKSNEVIESPDLAQPIAEVEIVIPFDTIAKPKEVMPELEDQIEEPEKPKADTIVSPDGRYYMVFPTGNLKYKDPETGEEYIDEFIYVGGVYDSRSGKLISEVTSEDEYGNYKFVKNQDYVLSYCGYDYRDVWIYVTHLIDPSKGVGLFCNADEAISSTGRYISFVPHRMWNYYEFNGYNSREESPLVIVYDMNTGNPVFNLYESSESDSCYGTCFIKDSNEEYLLVGFLDEKTAVYAIGSWKLINTIPISLPVYYFSDCLDGFEIECKNGCIWDEVTEKYYKLDPRR